MAVVRVCVCVRVCKLVARVCGSVRVWVCGVRRK